MFFVGLFSFVAGVLLLKRENRLFRNSVCTTAYVVDYDNYFKREHSKIMYTMVVEYTSQNGTLIQAREQLASSRKKFPVGTEISIIYSLEKSDFFIVRGDHSRKIGLIGMIIVGPLLIALAFLFCSENESTFHSYNMIRGGEFICYC